MAAGGMAEDEAALALAPIQERHRRPRLRDDLGEADIGAEVVARDRHRDAVPDEAARDMAEQAAVEGAPVAAVEEERQRRAARIALRQEEIEPRPLGVAIGEAELGPGAVAEGGRGMPPAVDDRRVLGHPATVVVLGFEVEPHGAAALRPRAG